MADFVEKEDQAFSEQLTSHATALGTHGPTLGFSAAEITDADKDAKLFKYILERQGEVQAYGQEFTGYKNLARYGNGAEVLTAVPVIAAFPVSPAITGANIEGKFRLRAAKAKSSGNFNISIGEALKIVAPGEVFDPTLGKPTFKIFMDSGHPVLKWVKDKFEGVDIYKDSGTGVWVKKERDLKSPWVDTDPLPPAGQSAVWKYKMIYVFDDKTTGSYSDEVTVTVYGNV